MSLHHDCSRILESPFRSHYPSRAGEAGRHCQANRLLGRGGGHIASRHSARLSLAAAGEAGQEARQMSLKLSAGVEGATEGLTVFGHTARYQEMSLLDSRVGEEGPMSMRH
jgi:hypothetical protein